MDPQLPNFAPDVPSSHKPRLPAAVRWLGSVGLFRGLRKLTRLALEGDAIDARDWMQPNLLVWRRTRLENLIDPTAWGTLPEAPPDGALWFDYVADTGDDGCVTRALAYLLHGDLWLVPHPDGSSHVLDSDGISEALHLPRGAFLILGGDTAYPVATAATLRERFMDPFDTAYQQRFGAGGSELPPRPLLGLPGNHDWADSLDGFGRLLRAPLLPPLGSMPQRPGAAGGPLRLQGYQALQSASYVAIRLPWQWDLWGVDLHTGHLDYRQRGFSQAIDLRRGGPQPTGRKLLLLCTRPVVACGHNDDVVEQELQTIIGGADALLPPFQLRLDLAGDIHNYQRYDLTPTEPTTSGQRVAVVAGGGGAFLHPTHPRLGPLPAQAVYPTPEDSRDTFQGLFTPWTLYGAGMLPWLLVLLQLAFLWRLLVPEEGAWLVALSPLAGVYGVWVGRDFPAPARRRAMGIGAGLGTLVALGMTWLMVALPAWGWATLLWACLGMLAGLSGGLRTRPEVHPAWAVLWILTVAGLEAWLPYAAVQIRELLPGMSTTAVAVGWAVVMLIGSPVLLGVYLLGALRMGAHLNEAAAALRRPRYRHFLRFKLEPGRLTGYVIGVDWPSPASEAPREARLIDQFTLEPSISGAL